MKKLTVLQFGARELREKAAPVSVFDEKIHEAIDDMAYTLRERGDGAAIAANQVGILQRIVVIDTQDEYYELVNPKIVEQSGTQYEIEGCLSLDGFQGKVPRFLNVKVRYQDRNGEAREIEAEGFMAKCLQHEIDHLDGVLYTDRMVEGSVWNPDTGAELGLEEVRRLSRSSA